MTKILCDMTQVPGDITSVRWLDKVLREEQFNESCVMPTNSLFKLIQSAETLNCTAKAQCLPVQHIHLLTYLSVNWIYIDQAG